MKKFLVLVKLKHKKNSDKGNEEHHLQTVDALTFGEAEILVQLRWAKMDCEAEIFQISLIR